MSSHNPHSPTSSTPAREAAALIAETRRASLQPILEIARPAVTLLPIDMGLDAFERELQRQAYSPC